MKLAISCLFSISVSVMETSLMSVLFKVATMSREGGRATEERSSAMVNGGCR